MAWTRTSALTVRSRRRARTCPAGHLDGLRPARSARPPRGPSRRAWGDLPLARRDPRARREPHRLARPADVRLHAPDARDLVRAVDRLLRHADDVRTMAVPANVTPLRTHSGRAAWARRASVCAVPSTCSWGSGGRWSSGQSWPTTLRSGRLRRRRFASRSERTSSRSWRRWTGCRSRCGCWTRRCRATDAEKQSQLDRLADFHTRHREHAPAALARLKETATSGGNVFHALMDAVRVCSLGQISAAFFEVGGQSRRNV